MVDYECKACGASFPTDEALRLHARTKMNEESLHYRLMSAHGETVPIYPTDQEKPA